MGCDFLADGNRPEDPKCDVPPFAEQFTIVITVMLCVVRDPRKEDKIRRRFDVSPCAVCSRWEKVRELKLTLTNRAGPKNRWFFFMDFE